jgi:Flp pilus assembly protein TadD
MSALSFFGRISAYSLFLAVQAASQVQPAVAQPQLPAQPPDSSLAAAAPTDPPFSVTVLTSPQVFSDEQKGDALFTHERYQAALEAYSKVAQPSAALWNKMGIAHQMLFDSKNAIRCYKESLKLNPDFSEALNNLATIEDSRNDFSAAERLYRRALKVEPGAARVFKNLGTDLLLQHKYRESADAYAQALALDPHIFDAHPGPSTETLINRHDRAMENYLKARSCARAGLNECALVHLRQAFDEGSATSKQVANDKDFEAVRQTPGYERLMADQQ